MAKQEVWRFSFQKYFNDKKSHKEQLLKLLNSQPRKKRGI